MNEDKQHTCPTDLGGCGYTGTEDDFATYDGDHFCTDCLTAWTPLNDDAEWRTYAYS